jgi:cell wall assembly regulator SMI1
MVGLMYGVTVAGSSDAGVAVAEGEIGAFPPSPVRQLYRRHDGGSDNPAETLWLRHDLGFLPIEAARQIRREIAEEEFGLEEADDFWSPPWFPIGTVGQVITSWSIARPRQPRGG